MKHVKHHALLPICLFMFIFHFYLLEFAHHVFLLLRNLSIPEDHRNALHWAYLTFVGKFDVYRIVEHRRFPRLARLPATVMWRHAVGW